MTTSNDILSTLNSFIGICSLIVSGVPFSASLASQSLDSAGAPLILEEVLNGVRQRKREYVEAFKNLTADETKVTETFDKKGNLERQRKTVASFLVYQSQIDDQKLFEYHVVREVDGKPIDNYVKRQLELFDALVKTKSLENEWKRLHTENTRYRLKYERWGLTLNIAPELDSKASPYYDYEIVGRQKFDGREMIVLSYRNKSQNSGQASVSRANTQHRYVASRGRVWIEHNSFNIYRWENEWLSRDKETDKVYVRVRDVVDYVPSDLGIPVPKRIVSDFFDRANNDYNKGEGQNAIPRARITFSYESFKRFEVTSKEQLSPVRKE